MKNLSKISMVMFTIIIIIAILLTLGIVACGSNESSLTYATKPILTTKNYTVYIQGADNITYIRYAQGTYTTTSEIKNASDCVTLNSTIIDLNTVNGTLAYEMPDGGIYSFWIKTADGNQYIYSATDMTNMEPEVSTSGINITISNLYGMSDVFIAKGTWSTYREIKTNGYITSVKDKLIGAKTYTYPVKDEGNYTVLARYRDGSVWYENFTIDCLNPTFKGNGLQLTVGNLEGVKCIRTTYGHFTSISDIKKSENHRTFTAKTVLKGLNEYSIQYRNNGEVTVVVQYDNGYYEFYYYEPTQKVPTFTQEENIVTFGNLNGLKTLRYAKGNFSTSYEIKHADGSTALNSSAIINGSITLILEPGTYSFCVQYDDESYNFYVVTIGSNDEPTEATFTKMYKKDENGDFIKYTLPYWLYTPVNATEGMPLIVVLHCTDLKRKEDVSPEITLDQMFTAKADLPKYISKGFFGEIPAYIIMPQTTSETQGWAERGKEIIEIINFCKEKYKVNTDNGVSIMGFSMGGTGAFELAAAYPEVFTRVLSVSGGLDGVTNNTRPYIQNSGRMDLSLYPNLLIPDNSNDTGYKKYFMKYQYEFNEEKKDTYLVTTRDEIMDAVRFENYRTTAVAQILKDNAVQVWALAGTEDKDVVPHVSKNICKYINTDNDKNPATFDEFKGYGHADMLKHCLSITDEIIDFLLPPTTK